MNRKAIEKTELNKILSLVAEYAVLDGSRERLKSLSPETDLSAAKKSLELTEECVKLLFTFRPSRTNWNGPQRVRRFPAASF